MTVNGLITTYWNDEAASDATKTASINAAGVAWGDSMASAWTAYDNAAAAAAAQQTLDDAQSANDAWHDIHAAYTVKLNADAAAGNTYTQAAIDAESAFYTTVVPEWVTYSDAMTDAGTAHSMAGNNAYAAAVGRWASAEGGPFSAFTAAIEAAEAAHDNAMVEAYGVRFKDIHAAEAAWTLSEVGAWATYAGEVSDHGVAWMAEAAPAWEDYQNAEADAGLAYTQGAVPLGVALTADLASHFEAWVSDILSAEQTYGNTLAANNVAWVASATGATESWANDTLVNWTTEVHSGTEVEVLLAGVISESFINWAGTVAGQLTGVPYTPVITTNPLLTQSTGTSNGATAYGAQEGGTGGGGGWDSIVNSLGSMNNTMASLMLTATGYDEEAAEMMVQAYDRSAIGQADRAAASGQRGGRGTQVATYVAAGTAVAATAAATSLLTIEAGAQSGVYNLTTHATKRMAERTIANASVRWGLQVGSRVMNYERGAGLVRNVVNFLTTSKHLAPAVKNGVAGTLAIVRNLWNNNIITTWITR